MLNSLAQREQRRPWLTKNTGQKPPRERGRKGVLDSEFTALGLPFIPTEANFIFVDTGVDVALFKCLLQKG